jgi:quinol monooxygenase YgiN
VIIVIASIVVHDGKRDEYIDAFKGNLPAVHAEAGCVEYFPAIDVNSGMPSQQVNANCVTIVEKWQTLSALQAHSTAKHMVAFREQVQALVESTSLKIVEAA